MSGVEVSVVIPTWNGGALLDKTLQAIFAQRTARSFEVVVVDSGSDAATMAILRRHPVELIEIPNAEFNHGLTRDLGADRASGRYLIFINQDATPGDESWLDEMVRPLVDAPEVLAVQGGIRERDDVPRFYWDSCGPRFYFTSEATRWIRRYHGIGFSTVNCAIRRETWAEHRFGRMDTFEDKAFQRQIHRTGREIASTAAFVRHTHDYDFEQLRRRCREEGYGWRLVGEDYSWWRSVRDMFSARNCWRLLRGLATGRIRSWAEIVYPFMRSRWVFQGNHRGP
ncbi:MAG: glycosyltransferase family 2 protein [Planctomycetes bacterium]|nr:glycosyltransferase family 2 protein [Planctomycetota bacterium]